MAFDISDLPPHVSPRFDYWAPDRTEDQITDFMRGESMARDYLSSGIEGRALLTSMLATMRDKQHFGEVEAGFICAISRAAIIGAKPVYFDEVTPPELDPEQFVAFWLGMLDAIADLEAASSDEIARTLVPFNVLNRVKRAVLHAECTTEFAGYGSLLISAATAAAAH